MMKILPLFPLLLFWAIVLLTGVDVVGAQEPLQEPAAVQYMEERNATRDILNKGHAAIPAAEKAAIINKWPSVKFDHGISPAHIWTWVQIISLVVSGILLLLFLWTRSLKKQVYNRTVEINATNQALKVEIAERKQAGKALANSELKYRSLVDNSLMGVFNTDLAGKFSFVNDAMVQIFDFESTEQMLAINSHSLWAVPEHREQMLQLLKKHGKLINYEAECVTHTGKHIHVIFAATLVDESIVGMGMEITERKHAEEKLRLSESKYRTLLENLPQKIFLKDTHSTYISCNENFARDIGVSPEEIMGKRDDDFFPLELADQYREDDKRVLESGQTERLEEQYILEGKKYWVATTKIPVLDDNGVVTGLLGAFLDITERKQAEKKLLEYQQRLKSLAIQLTLVEEQERGRIAEDLHDHVGQSLALTRMQLAAARKGMPKSDQRDAQFDDISQSLLKAIQDTRHLIFELSSPSLNELGLASAISEWMDENVLKQHGIEAELFDNAQELPLNVDLRTILFRNVRELLINVIKHARAKTISVWLESRAEGLEVTIQDDGVGFDYGNSQQSDDSFGGFGLFSVRERMSDLGGKMTISSQPGAGCKIVLLLPLHEQTSETQA